ncbi:MAG: hypothetical protein ACRDJP_00395 [Actinomycetota bacterium]
MRTLRSISLLVVGTLLGTLLVGSAVAHVGGVRHLIKHLKKTFYTEAEADERFLTDGEGDDRFLTPAEAEAGFLPKGEITLSQAGPWMATGSAEVTMPSTYVQINPTASSDVSARLLLTAPVSIGGTSYALRDVEICYAVEDGTGGDKIDSTAFFDFVPSGSTVMFTDETDRTSTSFSPFACYTVTDPSPNVPTGSPTVLLSFFYDDDTTDTLSIKSATATWVPV